MDGIRFAVNPAEAERFKERWIRGQREKPRQGKKFTGGRPTARRPRPGTLRIVPNVAAAVGNIFALAAHRALG